MFFFEDYCYLLPVECSLACCSTCLHTTLLGWPVFRREFMLRSWLLPAVATKPVESGSYSVESRSHLRFNQPFQELKAKCWKQKNCWFCSFTVWVPFAAASDVLGPSDDPRHDLPLNAVQSLLNSGSRATTVYLDYATAILGFFANGIVATLTASVTTAKSAGLPHIVGRIFLTEADFLLD